MLGLPQPIREHAEGLASSLSPHAIHQLRDQGLNRSFRRRLMALSRKGKLTATDLPTWLVMLSFIGVINAQP